MTHMVTTEQAFTDTSNETTVLRTPIDKLIIQFATRIGGSKAKEVERFIKFAIVGTLGFVIDFGTVFILQSTILPPANEAGQELTLNVAIATSIAFAAAVTSNFTWNRIWTYPDSRSRSIRTQLSQFAIVSISGWLARTLWISLAFVPLGTLAVTIVQALSIDFSPNVNDQLRIGTFIAQFIGVFVIMIWNFFANRYWTYNDVD